MIKETNPKYLRKWHQLNKKQKELVVINEAYPEIIDSSVIKNTIDELDEYKHNGPEINIKTLTINEN